MIIDFHNHIGLSQDGGHGTLETLISNMKKLKIKKSVLFATDEKDKGKTYELPNQRILEAQRRHPNKIIAFTRIVPTAGDLAVEEFKRCCREGAHGLKLKTVDGYDPEDSRLILDLIGRKKYFPVLMHTAHDQHSQPKRWEAVVKDYPHLSFIFAHGSKDHYRKCTEVAIRYPNVYIDTSTLSLNRTRYIYEHAGPKKLLFASDYPYSHPAIELKKYEICVKDKDDLAAILYHNGAKLLNIK